MSGGGIRVSDKRKGDGFHPSVGTPVADVAAKDLGDMALVGLLKRMERRCRSAEAILKNARDNRFGRETGVYTFDTRVADHLECAFRMDAELIEGCKRLRPVKGVVELVELLGDGKPVFKSVDGGTFDVSVHLANETLNSLKGLVSDGALWTAEE